MSEALTTGWEPDLPVHDSLLRQFVHSYADRTTEMALASGGKAGRDAEATFADLGSPILFDNAVVLLRPPSAASLSAVLDRADAFFPPERPWILFSAFPLPADDSAAPGSAAPGSAAASGSSPAGRGLTLIGHPPLMVRPPGGTPPPVPPDLRILPVTTSTDLAVFRQVLADGFENPSGEDAAIGDPRLLGGPLHLFVGYAAGTPVATAGAGLHHGMLTIEWVATVPQARGRGYGTAVTWRAIQVAPTLPAALIASDPGQPVYERMGFLRVVRATMWARLPK
jgi:hypothetical protein